MLFVEYVLPYIRDKSLHKILCEKDKSHTAVSHVTSKTLISQSQEAK